MVVLVCDLMVGALVGAFLGVVSGMLLVGLFLPLDYVFKLFSLYVVNPLSYTLGRIDEVDENNGSQMRMSKLSQPCSESRL